MAAGWHCSDCNLNTSMTIFNKPNQEFIIKDTHRGLWFEDGKLVKTLQSGRYRIPNRHQWFRRLPTVECVVVDIRSRELTIKGQEILTSDKVAIRVNIIAQYAVVDPTKAITVVEQYEERLYSDIQLAARRSLASMSLDEILTNRTRLSQDILSDVKESSLMFGVEVQRADVKDLIFPGNLQEIMNRVLAAERNSQALLVDAKTKSEVEAIQAKSRADSLRIQTDAETATSEARLAIEARQFAERVKEAKAYADNPALMKLKELETLKELGQNANAQLHVGSLDTSSSKSRGFGLLRRGK
jgi:regulator of protease activity HflC (stomatin/prohibitin superfamily)